MNTGYYLMAESTMKLLTFSILILIGVALEARNCGSIPNPRIVNGQEAALHQFPFQVYVTQGTTFCGGAIIREDVVVTAGHCVNSSFPAYVLAGTNEPGELNPAEQYKKSKQIIVHENFTTDNSTSDRDIALIIFQKPFKIDNITAQVIPLNVETSLVGDVGYATGWGRTSTNGPNSDKLRYMTAKIITNTACHNSLGGDALEDELVCLDGSEGSSTCYGDSGGPMFIERNGEYVLAGISAYVHDNGCDLRYPTVYTRISEYIGWINDKLAGL